MVLRDNNHWEEELRSRLWTAKQWKEKLEAEIKLQQLALEKWVAYIEALEQARELEGELDVSSGAFMNGIKAKTVTESLILFAFRKPEHVFAAKDSINWLIEQGLYSDEKGAGDSVYGILAQRTDLFKRQDRAVYKLTEKAIDIGNSLTQPRIPFNGRPSEPALPPKGVVRHTPLASFILESLRDGEKTMHTLKVEAEKAGIDFSGKKPGRVLHFALLGMAQNGLTERVNGTWKLKESTTEKQRLIGGAYMKCPACQQYTATNSMNVARHMMTVFDEPHIKWIEANGLNPAELLGMGGKGDYKPLAELLEKIIKRNS